MAQTTIYSPGPRDRTVKTSEGLVLDVPLGWVLLPPGDAGLTRRVKAAGDHWVIKEKRGRRTFSRGVWAAADTIQKIKADLQQERSTESYAKRQAANAKRRQKVQTEYVDEFHKTVLQFLDFHPDYEELAQKLATAVTRHATPVGSGTVARTKQISVDRRAEAAVIAWMRHQTTAYDSMQIPRIKGMRREVRRALAAKSKDLLQNYRQGKSISADCPLSAALTD